MLLPALGKSTPLLMLYASRLAGVAVSLIFIPLYARLLGPEQFGFVALILSVQAMLIMLDMGMSSLLARDIAAAPSGSSLGRQNWRQAERLLSIGLLGLSGLALTTVAIRAPSRLPEALMALVMFWALVLQNLSQAAMIAKRDYRRAGLIQILGVLGRALITAAALSYYTPSLFNFLLSQVLGALAHLGVNRWLCEKALSIDVDDRSQTTAQEPLGKLAQRGFPLFVMGIAGAAVLQVDKLIVGAFMSPGALSTYFLATTFCMTPIAILAAPVAQFFQPQIIRACSADGRPLLLRKTRQLTVALLLAVVVPSFAIWVWRDTLIELWLRDGALAGDVAALTTIMLPAAVIGAVGNVPLALLHAMQDFKFQARLSSTLTLLTLAGVLVSAQQSSLQGVCWTYLAYYSALTLLLWARAAGAIPSADAARDSAKTVLMFCAATAVPLALLRLW